VKGSFIISRIILKWVLAKHNVMICSGFIWLSRGSTAMKFRSITDREFSDYQLLKHCPPSN
jgi:hypothetical protein